MDFGNCHGLKNFVLNDEVKLYWVNIGSIRLKWMNFDVRDDMAEE